MTIAATSEASTGIVRSNVFKATRLIGRRRWLAAAVVGVFLRCASASEPHCTVSPCSEGNCVGCEVSASAQPVGAMIKVTITASCPPLSTSSSWERVGAGTSVEVEGKFPPPCCVTARPVTTWGGAVGQCNEIIIGC